MAALVSNFPWDERHAVSPVASGRASIETRRKQGWWVLLASMVVSVAIHAFVLSRSIKPPDAPNERAATALRLPDTRSGIRISGILVPPLAAPLVVPEPATRVVVAEPDEPEPEDPPPTSDPEPEDPSPELDLERPEPLGTGAAAALRAGPGNPLFWGNIRDNPPRAGLRRVVLPERRVDHMASGSTPADPWAFDTWTTRDAGGRLWGAAPGALYLAGITIRFRRERFDASDCGFGLPPWRRGDYQFFLRAWKEIEGQVQRGAIRERARAMRARREGREHPGPPDHGSAR